MAILCGYAQTPTVDLSWSFQWGEERFGLLFEDTNLTTSAKAAIRDDIQLVYSYNPSTNVTYRVYQNGDSKFGQYTGKMCLSGRWVCPQRLNSWDYKIYGGTNYFCVTPEDSARYLLKIALTNQFYTQVVGLSNFLYTVKTMTTNNITQTTFAQMFWIHDSGRCAQVADMGSSENINANIQFWASGTYYLSSLLQYWDETEGAYASFGCTVNVYYPSTSWRNERDTNPEKLIYKDGQWRFVLRPVD